MKLVLAQDGGCPSLVGLNPGSWESWKDVPAAVASALKCIEPKKKETFDWSAQATECSTGMVQTVEIGAWNEGSEGEQYFVWCGDSNGAYAAGPTFNPFLSEYDLAQTASSSETPGTLGVVLAAHPGSPGIDFDGSVTVEHFDAGSIAPDNVFMAQVGGQMVSDGRFDTMLSVSILSPSGQNETSIERLSFDGSCLRWVAEGSEVGNEYAASYERFTDVFTMLAATVAPTFWWTFDPFEAPLFADLVLEELPDPETGWILVRRTFQDVSGTFVGTEYLVDDAGEVSHPVRLRVLDSLGQMREEWIYSDYRVLEEGVWRPWEVVRSVYLDGTVTGRRVVVTSRFVRARNLTQEENQSVPAPYADDQVWQVWM
ncbi:MAG: hypothetical protein AB1793_09795 [Candidatus Thermoplasmatota archaeon]